MAGTLHGTRVDIYGTRQLPGMVPEGVDVRVSGEMLFAPLVFLAALVLCVVLNLLSVYTGVVFLAETDCELTE